jgi:glycosyltransferase involved in cell wall biosynthesis
MLVDVRSPEAVARAMLRLAEDTETRLTLGRAARESAWRRFRFEVVAESYEEVYEEVLANSKRDK